MPSQKLRPGNSPLSSITLLLSGRCNLTCAYCYQDARRCSDALPFDAAKAALDRLLASRAKVRTVEFNGGEPLLEWKLLQDCVEYARFQGKKNRPLRFLLTTNGTLLTPDRLEWLETHHFSIRLSFDGTPEAQNLRGEGTFRRLDKLLDGMRHSFPFLFSRLRIHAGVLPETVPCFAESAAYFLDKGVPEVYFYPISDSRSEWPPERIVELREQAARIVESSAAHFEREGTVPILFLRDGGPAGTECPDDDRLCGATRGEGFCVDPDGNAWTCAYLADTLVDVPASAREAARAAALGDVRDARFLPRLASVPQRAMSVSLLTGRTKRASGYRACADCEFLPECRICPAAISQVDREGDGTRVSDFACAFTMATLEARRTFAERTGGKQRDIQLQRLREAASALTEALRRAP